MNSKESGTHLWLILWKSYKALESYDRQSISNAGFACLSDFALLEVIYHKGPLPVNTIAEKVFLTSGSMTTAVNRAVKSGWVEKKADPADGRVVQVHLTQAGRSLIQSAFAQHAQNLERAFSMLDGDERKELGRLLKKVGKTAEALSL